MALERIAEDRKEWQKLIKSGSYTPAFLADYLEEEERSD